jgi:pyruvate formate lyase activating enzyme
LEYTGVLLKSILQNLISLNELKIPFILRLPIIPGINDREEHFLKVKTIAEKLQFCRGIQSMPYHKLGEYKYQQLGRDYLCQHITEPTKEQVREWENFFKSNES